MCVIWHFQVLCIFKKAVSAAHCIYAYPYSDSSKIRGGKPSCDLASGLNALLAYLPEAYPQQPLIFASEKIYNYDDIVQFHSMFYIKNIFTDFNMQNQHN